MKFGIVAAVVAAIASYPLRVRGLKSRRNIKYTDENIVVPLEGTWIEIGFRKFDCGTYKSYPLRVRGLKYSFYL